ncbi:hypothetical protein [Achromobacter marplatensis]|uniref:hypothetical protein n=1 Tax=Achromobacter marplatensis TaxID=470868 RepID=UPI000277E3E7|nr:hypothetical protein [Achromobacter marplatensis]EJO30528.1 hypothetical protein QWC_17112 [Achromobacter marplatensis]
MNKSSVLTLVAVPLIVGVISLTPYIDSRWNPERDLQFSLGAFADVQPMLAFRLNLENKGKLPEKGVQIFMDARGSTADSIAEQLIVDAKVPTEKKRDGDRLVVSVGDLRPKETLSIGFASQHIVVTAYDLDRPPLGLSVKSESSLAEYQSPYGFWDKHYSMILSVASSVLLITVVYLLSYLIVGAIQARSKKRASPRVEGSPEAQDEPVNK